MSHLLLQGSHRLLERAAFSSFPTRAQLSLQTYERSLDKGIACDSSYGFLPSLGTMYEGKNQVGLVQLKGWGQEPAGFHPLVPDGGV